MTSGNARAILACWGAALLLVTVICLAMARPLSFTRPDFTPQPVAAIGSSLTANAFPPSAAGGNSLLGDGRGHTRIGVARTTPEEIDRLLGFAIDDGVDTVILEIRVHLYALRDEALLPDCLGLVCRVDSAVAEMRGNFRARIRRVLGMAEESFGGRLALADREAAIDSPYGLHYELAHFYPLEFRADQPDATLAQLVERAKRKGVQVVLFLPPRSPAASAFLGAQTSQVIEQAHRFARALDVPLFAMEDGWEEKDFVDQAHLSRAGRERLMAGLRDWWKEQH